MLISAEESCTTRRTGLDSDDFSYLLSGLNYTQKDLVALEIPLLSLPRAFPMDALSTPGFRPLDRS